MALITAPMTDAMKQRARAALEAAELPADTELSPREFRHLVLQQIPAGVDEATFRAELIAEGWFTSDEQYGIETDDGMDFVAAADERVAV